MRLGRALLVLVVPAFAALAGCELIAGTRDITEGEGVGEDDANGDSPGTNDALSGSDTPGSTGGDATASDATASDATNSGDAPPGTDGTVGGEAGSDATGLEATTGADAQADTNTKQDSAPDTSTFDAAGSTYVLIDDMETNSGEISAPNAGNGYWFTYGDGTAAATETPAPMLAPFPDSMISGGRTIPASFGGGTSMWAAQVSGSGFDTYAGMGFNFKAPVAAYNASSYSGFVFWGRILGSGSGAVTFSVPDGNTYNYGTGSVCTTCDAYFFTSITLTAAWQQFTILYSSLTQPSFGVPQEAALDAAHLYKVLFQVSTKAPAGEPFDIWVDDLYFIKP